MLTIRAEGWHNGYIFSRNSLNKLLSLHILMMNLVINLLTVSSGYSELHCRSGPSRKSGGAERSDERALQKNDGAERERSGERGLHK